MLTITPPEVGPGCAWLRLDCEAEQMFDGPTWLPGDECAWLSTYVGLDQTSCQPVGLAAVAADF